MAGYSLTTERNDPLTQATMWINLKNIRLSERSQTEKATCCKDSFT